MTRYSRVVWQFDNGLDVSATLGGAMLAGRQAPSFDDKSQTCHRGGAAAPRKAADIDGNGDACCGTPVSAQRATMYQSMINMHPLSRADASIGGEVIHPTTAAAAMRRLAYDPYAAGDGRQMVPRIFADRLPDDLARPGRMAERQQTFVAILLPIVLRANEILAMQRSTVRQFLERDGAGDGQAVAAFAQTMRLFGSEDPAELYRRFDGVPPSLIIGLAAATTDWGRAKSAYGLRQILPEALSAPSDLEPEAIRAADGVSRAGHRDLLSAVLDCMHALNTRPAGAAFRRERSRQRSQRRHDGYRLALLLNGGSHDRSPFVRDVLYAIEGAALTRLDRARLEPPKAIFH